VSIASVLVVVDTAACATAPHMRERAPDVRSRMDMPYNMAASSDLDFRLLFCMKRGDFWALLGVVRDRLVTNEVMEILSSGQPIPVECRLAIALRVLAGASYLDIMLAFGVGSSTVIYVCKQVCILRLSVRRGEQGVAGDCDFLFISGTFCVYTHTFCPYFLPLIQVLGALDDAE